MRRRNVLALGAGALTAGLAGCSQVTNSTEDGGGVTLDPETDSDVGTTNVDSQPSLGAWTSFRGDASRRGVRPADAGPGPDPSIAWTVTFEDVLFELTGTPADELTLPLTVQNVSAALVAGGNAVFMLHATWMSEDDDSTSRKQWLLAIDTEEGSLDWSVELWSSSDSEGSPAQMWPEVDDGQVYAPVFDGGGLVVDAYDAETGDRRTRLDLGLTATAGQPVVTDGTLYVRTAEQTGPGMVRAFDAESGDERWSVEASPPGRNPVVDVSVTEDSVWYFDRGDPGAVVARSRTNGEERARVPVDLPRSVISRRPGQLGVPVPVDGTAYGAGTLDAMIQRDLSALAAVDPAGDSVEWTYRPPEVPTEWYRTLLGQQASDEEVERLAEEIDYSSAYGLPAVTDGLVLTTGYGGLSEGDDSQASHLLAVDAAEGSLQWAVQLDGVSFAPVVAGDTVYVATESGLEVVSLDGEQQTTVSFERASLIESVPAIADGRLYLSTFEQFVALE